MEVNIYPLRCCESEEFTLSRDNIDKAAHLLLNGVANKQMSLGAKTLYIDRSCLFICKNDFSSLLQERKSLVGEKILCYGSWKIDIVENGQFSSDTPSDWRSLWKGKSQVMLPLGNYELGAPKIQAPYPGSMPLGKWWTDHKVPAFFRLHVPVIYERGGAVCHEFLTGKRKGRQADGEWITITIT